jgi:hypothetical protein
MDVMLSKAKNPITAVGKARSEQLHNIFVGGASRA